MYLHTRHLHEPLEVICEYAHNFWRLVLLLSLIFRTKITFDFIFKIKLKMQQC